MACTAREAWLATILNGDATKAQPSIIEMNLQTLFCTFLELSKLILEC